VEQQGYRHGKLWFVHGVNVRATAPAQQAELERQQSPVPEDRDTLPSVQCARAIQYCADDCSFEVRDETRTDRPTLAKCGTIAEAERIAREAIAVRGRV
jgi:hypothetical protein